jgi:predicted phage terminase large subunit-like protein
VEKPFQNAWIQRWGPGTDVPALPPAFTDERGGHPGYVVECGFDPAISEKDTAARSALVVAAQVRHPSMRGRILILEAVAGHWSVYEQVRQILNAVVRWKARTCRVEDVAYQKSLKDILDREARTRGVHVHIELVKPDGDKLRRANAWSPLVEDGTVVFPTTGAEDLVACMLAVPGDPSKWDPVDAAGLCIRGFPPLEAAHQPVDRDARPKGQERAASYALRGRGLPLSAVVTWEQFRGFGARTPDLRRRARGYALRRPG